MSVVAYSSFGMSPIEARFNRKRAEFNYFTVFVYGILMIAQITLDISLSDVGILNCRIDSNGFFKVDESLIKIACFVPEFTTD